MNFLLLPCVNKYMMMMMIRYENVLRNFHRATLLFLFASCMYGGNNQQKACLDWMQFSPLLLLDNVYGCCIFTER